MDDPHLYGSCSLPMLSANFLSGDYGERKQHEFDLHAIPNARATRLLPADSERLRDYTLLYPNTNIWGMKEDERADWGSVKKGTGTCLSSFTSSSPPECIHVQDTVSPATSAALLGVPSLASQAIDSPDSRDSNTSIEPLSTSSVKHHRRRCALHEHRIGATSYILAASPFLGHFPSHLHCSQAPDATSSSHSCSSVSDIESPRSHKLPLMRGVAMELI